MTYAHRIGATVFLVFAFACGLAFGDSPKTDNPKGFTENDMLKATLEFNQRTLSVAYQQVGKRDPKWDDEVSKFLDGMARRMTVANQGIFDDLPKPPG